MNNLLRILFVSLVCIQVSHSQVISGKVLDAETKEPLAFANFIFNNNQKLYASSDINGRFSFAAQQEITSLVCSYVGYETQTVKIQKDKNIIVYLKASADALQEVVMRPG